MTAQHTRRRAIPSFWRDASAVSGVEFALIAPTVLALTFGAFDIYRYIYTTSRMQAAVTAVAQMYASLPPDDPNAANPVATVDDAKVALLQDGTILLYPDQMYIAKSYLNGWMSIELSYAVIDISGDEKSRVATTRWTADWGTHARPCGATYIPTWDYAYAAKDPLYLPAGILNFPEIVVIDFHLPFQPTFTSAFFGRIDLTRSAYAIPRYVRNINYKRVWGSNHLGKTCT